MREEFNRERFCSEVMMKLMDKGINAETAFEKVEKINESYEAITFIPKGSIIGLNLNLSEIMQYYEDGASFEACVERAVETVSDGLDNRPAIDLDSLSYESLKGSLSMEAVSAERNRAMLENIPHKLMEDIAIIYRFVLRSAPDGRASILITNGILEHLGITREQLFSDADEIVPTERPMVISNLADLIMKMMGMTDIDTSDIDTDMFPEESPLYVATTPDKCDGAGVIAYPDFFERASEVVGGSFYLLPSSIHEVIIVPESRMEIDASYLKSMVMEVNATQLVEKDKLTDNVYHYDSRKKIFETGEKYAARISQAAIG